MNHSAQHKAHVACLHESTPDSLLCPVGNAHNAPSVRAAQDGPLSLLLPRQHWQPKSASHMLTAITMSTNELNVVPR